MTTPEKIESPNDKQTRCASHGYLRSLVISRLGGVGAMSHELYGECLMEIAKKCNRVVDTQFRREVRGILRELPCALD